MRTIDQSRLAERERFDFIETKEYRRFAEFALACSQYRYIGLCYGEPGVGKSWAGEYYTKWKDELMQQRLIEPISTAKTTLIKDCKGIVYITPVTNTPKIINEALYSRLDGFGIAHYKAGGEADLLKITAHAHKLCSLVIIDEADRLAFNSLEQVRHLYDQLGFGLILMGMPGMEKRLSRYPQLYSRIGFSHQFRPLSGDEMRFILERRWQELNLEFNPNCFSDVEAINTIIRSTAGNFRLIERLFSQIKRLWKVNRLESMSKEVVDAARECLLMGSTPLAK